ncbi:unnamed protein product [Heligmosomoides polygyrus]|uniref:DDE_3 domain-containing protein n=1 Tax=Heligmosomoides polygyrus TaxID=6339 RepID=A0A183FSG7_HELPZ|nr:unnamed protein product [Heligmosomoides polygyrus]
MEGLVGLSGKSEPGSWYRVHATVAPPDCATRALIDWTFQQNWAPAHGAGKTLEWCEANLPDLWTKEVWPSNSPDLNPMDFTFWSILEQKACSFRHSALDSLKRALEKAWDKLSPKMIARILKNFRKRFYA